jgi:hypothetical protein
VIDVMEMSTDPLLFELWLVALCSLVNRTPAWIHEDVTAALALRGMLMRIEEDCLLLS